MTIKEIFERPALEDQTFIETKIFVIEDSFKALLVKWYLVVVAYGFISEMFK
jgi:hypothetical protein